MRAQIRSIGRRMFAWVGGWRWFSQDGKEANNTELIQLEQTEVRERALPELPVGGRVCANSGVLGMDVGAMQEEVIQVRRDTCQK